MPRRRTPPDRRVMIDYWRATRPQPDEHRLAFTINFSSRESNRLKRSGGAYLTEALRTVRNLLRTEGPVDIVLTVERFKKTCDAIGAVGPDLHAHGWLRVKRTVTADALQKKLNATSSKKLTCSRAAVISEFNRNTGKPIDSGWVGYITKDFDRTPTGCRRPNHKYAASKPVKSRAREARNQRAMSMRNLLRAFRVENSQIRQRKGEWTHWHLRDKADDVLNT